jgi:hypothetical protein
MADGNRVFDWDDVSEISEEEERGGVESAILPDGNYPFEVIKVDKEYYNGGEKIPACNVAKVFLRLDGGELGKGFAVENIYLVEKYQWKAAAFLRAIGLKKHGEPIEWRKLTHCDGETGRCEVYVDEYQGRNGLQKSNKIRRFFDKEEEAPKKAFKKGAF